MVALSDSRVCCVTQNKHNGTQAHLAVVKIIPGGQCNIEEPYSCSFYHHLYMMSGRLGQPRRACGVEPRVLLFVVSVYYHSFNTDISKASLQVHYYSEALRTIALRLSRC